MRLWLLLTIIIYALMDTGSAQADPVVKRQAGVARMVTVLFIASNFLWVGIYNTAMAAWQKPTRQLLARVDQLVRLHRHEPGFYFSVDPDVAGNIRDPWMRTKADPPDRKYPLVQALYWKSYNDKDPHYVVHASEVC